MIIFPIEKEIDTEHKIFKGLSFRQAICGGMILFIVMILYFTTHTLEYTVYGAIPFVIIFGLLGWYRKNGLHAEDYALKKIQTKIYNNETRKYRTKNKYVSIFNKMNITPQKNKKGKGKK